MRIPAHRKKLEPQPVDVRDLIAIVQLARELNAVFAGPKELARAQARAQDGYAARFQRWLVDVVGGEASTP